MDWWNEIYKDYTSNYRLGLTFEGGTEKFRYYSVVDYMYDIGLFRNLNTDSRYSTIPSDVRLSIRSNFDVEVTRTTHLKLGIMAKLGEYNKARGADQNMTNVYSIPSAAFPVRQYDGNWGGTAVYTGTNPVASLADSGNYRFTTGTVVADMSLRQDLDILTEGLGAELLVSFEDTGRMYDETSKNFAYEDSHVSMSDDGTVITSPEIVGTNSRALGHSNGFYSIDMRTDFQAKIDYARTFGRHAVSAAAIYDMQSYVANGQNYGETLLQIGPQVWNVDELAHVSAASTTRVTVTFDEAPLTTYVQRWDEKDLSKDDLAGKPLAWRARYWRDFANTLGEEVPSTFEDDVLTFDVTPGRRYAISTRFGPDPSEGDRVEYVFTVS